MSSGKFTTAERLITMETKVDIIREDISEIKGMIKDFDNKFASKWTEKVAIGLLISVIGAIAIFILTTIA